MKKITDKQRLDFLQGLVRRTDKCVGFNGQVKMVDLDSELHIGLGQSYVMLRDKFGHGDFGGFKRNAKTVRQAIDKAIRYHSEKKETP